MKPAVHITFLHANGYPSGVYRQFFAALREHATVDAPAILEAPADSAAHQRWPMMLDQALDALQPTPPLHNAVLRHVLVGHSMGGYIALQAAVRHMNTIRDVVLIDSPIPTGWRSRNSPALLTNPGPRRSPRDAATPGHHATQRANFSRAKPSCERGPPACWTISSNTR